MRNLAANDANYVETGGTACNDAIAGRTPFLRPITLGILALLEAKAGKGDERS
jgi:hypothetical protein